MGWLINLQKCWCKKKCWLDKSEIADLVSSMFTTEECPVLHSYGAIGGAAAEFGDKCNAVVEKLGTGWWQVTFEDPCPTATYPVLFGSLNDASNPAAGQGNPRGTIVEVINGTQDANGFQIMAQGGDDGASPDDLQDSWVSFAVPGKKEFTVLASLKAGSEGVEDGE